MTHNRAWRFCAIHCLAVVLLAGLLAAGCSLSRPCCRDESWQDGTYRGAFIDEGLIQVNVQFTLQDGVVTAASFRHLVGANTDYFMGVEEEPYRSVVQQYQEALQYLVGKPLAGNLEALYRPEEIVTTQVDGYTAATIRSNKILSAIRDALNRGVYSH